MKTLIALLVIVAVVAPGCATIQHPDRPGVQYGSMEKCMQHNPQNPAFCEKVLHQRATNEAIGTGAAVAGTLAWLGTIAYILSILK